MNNQVRQILWVGYPDGSNRQAADKLKSIGYAVVNVASEAAALAQAKQRHFDLFIVDEWLTETSGLDFCRVLRSFDGATPVLLLAAEVTKPTFFTALRSGAQWLLQKPIEPYDLIATATRLICYGERKAQGQTLEYALSNPPQRV
jgi:DNA-binding response OmpR family regulator